MVHIALKGKIGAGPNCFFTIHPTPGNYRELPVEILRIGRALACSSDAVPTSLPFPEEFGRG
jgi:hypothetical protein